MRFIQKTFLLLPFFVLSVSVSAQNNAELGLRITQSPYNRFQLEFRKPFNDKYALRLGTSIGQDWGYPMESVFDANDSVVTMRSKSNFGNYYDLRLGINRSLNSTAFSIHGDLIFGYNRNFLKNTNYHHVVDSDGNWNSNPVLDDDPNFNETATAYDYFFSSGLSFGLSYDHQLTNHLVLSFNLNQTALMRFQFEHSEANDIYNEFHEGNSTLFEVYTTAGVGLRYKFAGKTVSE